MLLPGFLLVDSLAEPAKHLLRTPASNTPRTLYETDDGTQQIPESRALACDCSPKATYNAVATFTASVF